MMTRHLPHLAILLVFFCATPCWAQTTSTEILGNVTDATGAVVPNARVTLLRTATGERRTAATSGTGDYTFPLIEIGQYTVTVEMEGFKTQEKKGIVVELQQKARVDFKLEVGSTTERVEVVATGIELKTDDAAVGQVIDNKRVVELPLSSRNIAGLAVLTPGVQLGVRMGLAGTIWATSATVSVSANGQRDTNQQITLDGVVSSNPVSNTMSFTPSIDAIEEFKVQTSSYSAEYGQNSGAIVQVALKAGTNQLRGTLFEFLRNDSVDAKDYFLNFQLPAGAKQQSKNRLRRNQFGAFLSGPVVLPKIYNGRDRTFWSFNWEAKHETQESVQETFWFPEPFRRGDFSALLTPLVRDGKAIRSPIIIYDPLNGEPFRDGSGRITNLIPASRINRSAQNFVNQFMPLPMFQPEDILDSNVRASVPNILTNNEYFFRIDHHFSSNDRVFFRFAGDWAEFEQKNINPNFPSFGTATPRNVAFQHVHVFTPAVLNEFRYGFNYTADVSGNPRANTGFDLDSLGIGKFRVGTEGRKLTPQEQGIPSTGILPGDARASTSSNAIHQFSDNFLITNGKHNLKLGFEYRRVSMDAAVANTVIGALGGGAGAYSLAGWLMGYPNSSQTGEGLPPTKPRQNRWGAYFLDDWKVSRKLTANVGIRWDFFQAPYDAAGGMRSLRLDVLSTAADGRQLPTLVPNPDTNGYRFYETDNRYFMPRIGLAYRATDKWVIRSGFGWFVNAQNLNNSSVMALSPPRSGTLSFNQITDVAQVIQYAYAGQTFNIQTRKFRPGTPILTLDDIFPGQGTAASRTNLTLMPPDNKYNSHVQWSLDIQRSLPARIFLTVGYVGSKSTHLDLNVGNFNSPDPSSNTDINSRRPWQAYVSQGEGSQARGLGTIRYLDFNGNGNYHGLQSSVEKRYSFGLSAGLSYTYSKALGEGYERNLGGSGVAHTLQNPRDRRSDRSRYTFDVTHNAVMNFVYDLPFFKSLRGVGGAVLSGWQTNGIINLRTGLPFNVSGGGLNTGGPTYPDRVADGRLFGEARRELWFDPTAFRRTDCNIPGRPDLCHYGNAGPGILTMPGARNFDLSFGKNFRIPPLGESGRLQFRAELFNAFNTPQFGRPNGIGFSTLDSIIPDAPRQAEIRTLQSPMRIVQFGMKLYF